MILGLGRLGGEALTHASDLDIIYLFTGDFAAESDGRRPLGATLYFNRLAQRVSAALSVPTAEGALYEVDTRLRPQGTQGPLAATVESFERYQREEAWVWEHMALERARVLYGSPKARAQVEAIIHTMLTAPRDQAKTLVDVIEMRARMAEHKTAKGTLDVKLMRGGLVDVEFIVHALQLTTGKGMNQRLSKAIAALVGDGLMPPAMMEAHGVLGRVLVASRLLAPDGMVPGDAPCAVLAKACGLGDWKGVEQALGDARRVVAQCWHDLFGQDLEID